MSQNSLDKDSKFYESWPLSDKCFESMEKCERILKKGIINGNIGGGSSSAGL
jgi:hypothetical protein